MKALRKLLLLDMKLLLDANISWRLVKTLKIEFPDISHVSEFGFKHPATDKEIWDYAKKNNSCIVTNDEDFIFLMNRFGFPPKIILLRTGNQSTQYIARVLSSKKEYIMGFLSSEDYGLLEIY